VHIPAVLVTNKPLRHEKQDTPALPPRSENPDLGHPVFSSFHLDGDMGHPPELHGTHPSLEKSEGWATQTLWFSQGCDTRRLRLPHKQKDGY
jgi:hypothetical protein